MAQNVSFIGIDVVFGLSHVKHEVLTIVKTGLVALPKTRATNPVSIPVLKFML